MTTPRDVTSYSLVDTKSEAKMAIPGDPDGEWFALQYVYPTVNGTPCQEAASYRFIRITKEGKWKPQLGQGQVKDIAIILKLTLQMADMRGMTLNDLIYKTLLL